jgi:hypothetical protein
MRFLQPSKQQALLGYSIKSFSVPLPGHVGTGGEKIRSERWAGRGRRRAQAGGREKEIA